MNNMRIKRATVEDLAAIQVVDVAAYGEENSSHWLEEGLNDHEGYYFTVSSDDRLVAYCGMYHITSASPNFCKVATMAVLPDYQGKGIGKLMMQKILDTAKSLGLDRTKLEVRTGNDAAVHLYKSFGFVVEEYKEKYYDDGEDGYIMWRYNQS